jgi:hypothetical protein
MVLQVDKLVFPEDYPEPTLSQSKVEEARLLNNLIDVDDTDEEILLLAKSVAEYAAMYFDDLSDEQILMIAE